MAVLGHGVAMRSLSKLLLIFAILISFPTIPPCVDTTSTAQAHMTSDRGSKRLGSAYDYVRNDSQFLSNFEVPTLGIKLRNGTGKLGNCPRVPGVRVVAVSPDGPAARAGLRSQKVIVQTALTTALMAGSLVSHQQ